MKAKKQKAAVNKINILLLLLGTCLIVGCKNKKNESKVYFFNSKHYSIQVKSITEIDTIKWDSIFDIVIELKKITEKEYMYMNSKSRTVTFDWRSNEKPKILFFKRNDTLIYKLFNLEKNIDSNDIDYLNKLKKNLESKVVFENEEITFDITLPKVIHFKDSLNLDPIPPLPN